MTRRRVVTEREIQRVSRAGDTTLDVAGALVTPSARDAARRAKIELTGLGESTAPSRAQRKASARPDAAPARPGARAAAASRGKPAASAAAPSPSSSPPPQSASPRAKPGATSSPTASPGKADTHGGEKPLAVALGADHGGVSLKGVIADRLRELGLTVLDFGTVTKDPVDYPDFAVAVAQAVASGRATVGVMIDGAGIGSCMAANKVRGVRAAMCHDVTTATNAREHNNANYLTLGGGLIGSRLALTILETFLATPFAGGRHAARVAKIDALDRPG